MLHGLLARWSQRRGRAKRRRAPILGRAAVLIGSLAAFTIASTASRVMSPLVTTMRSALIRLPPPSRQGIRPLRRSRARPNRLRPAARGRYAATVAAKKTSIAKKTSAAKKTKQADDGALPKIGKPAERALASIGVARLEQVAKLTEQELSALHGMGPKAIGILREALKARGKTLRAK